MKAIINGRIIHRKEIVEDAILYFDQKILGLSREVPAENCEIIDASGLYVSAGFVDMHIHGSGGADVMDATPEALETISVALMEGGTTSFVATTMTMGQEEIEAALDNVVQHASEVTGAKIRGIHLEGPFLNPNKSGAQDSRYIQEANFDWITPYLEQIRVITIAPEIKGAEAFIKRLSVSHPHILLSIGHSDAGYDTALESFDWGISHATHLFNAMPPFQHRAPGIVGAVLDSSVTAEIIADLIHLHPSIVRMVHDLKKEKLILITDAMRAGCMGSGIYELGGQKVIVSDGRAILENGVLAGSVLRLNEAVKNYRDVSMATLAEAVYAATTLPARRLGLSCGELEEGYDADIILFDTQLDIKELYIDGAIKYRQERESREVSHAK